MLVGTSGEISGAAPFRDAIRAAPAEATLTVVGYARVKEKKKDKKATAEPLGVSATVLARRSATNAKESAFLSPATSPGRRARNYIRETEDEETDDGFNGVAYGYDPLTDPLAAPVGGHARARISRARSSTRARTEGTAEETLADEVVPRR